MAVSPATAATAASPSPAAAGVAAHASRPADFDDRGVHRHLRRDRRKGSEAAARAGGGRAKAARGRTPGCPGEAVAVEGRGPSMNSGLDRLLRNLPEPKSRLRTRLYALLWMAGGLGVCVALLWLPARLASETGQPFPGAAALAALPLVAAFKGWLELLTGRSLREWSDRWNSLRAPGRLIMGLLVVGALLPFLALVFLGYLFLPEELQAFGVPGRP